MTLRCREGDIVQFLGVSDPEDEAIADLITIVEERDEMLREKQDRERQTTSHSERASK